MTNFYRRTLAADAALRMRWLAGGTCRWVHNPEPDASHGLGDTATVDARCGRTPHCGPFGALVVDRELALAA